MALCLEDIIEEVLPEVVQDVEDALNTCRARKVGSYIIPVVGPQSLCLVFKIVLSSLPELAMLNNRSWKI